MPTFLKKLKHIFKRNGGTKDDDSRTRLLSNTPSQPIEPVDGDSRTQTCCYPNSTDQPATEPEIQAEDFDAEGQRVLLVLGDILLGNLRSQELKQAAEQVKQWAIRNGITPEAKEGSYSQNWLTKYLKIVEMSVEKHFSTLPPEGSKESQLTTEQYLKCAESLVSDEVKDLIPVLEDSRLLSYLIDSYNRRLFVLLDLLMYRSSSVPEATTLLQWVKQKYFSHGFNGDPNIQDGVFRVSDPLLVTHWFERSKKRFLTLIQEHISTVLQNILRYNEDHCDYRNEEDLIKVYLDVIQCLNATLQGTKSISQTLMTAVQRVCCDELHLFVQRYVEDEKTRLQGQKPGETYSVHLFKIIDTCKHFRSYALSIMDSNSKTDSSTLLMLENMEAHVLASLQQWLAGLAEDHLKKYFKENDIHIHNLMDMIQNIFAPLPQKEEGERTKQHIVNVAFQSVTRVYLRCLMQRKCKQMVKRWGDVDKMMMKDAELFHSTFKQLVNTENSVSEHKQKMFLLKMSEILGCNDTTTLKLICAPLYRDFPEESEEHLHALLKWKRGLSRRQMREIMDVSQEACENRGHITPCRLKYWSCCLCCT